MCARNFACLLAALPDCRHFVTVSTDCQVNPTNSFIDVEKPTSCQKCPRWQCSDGRSSHHSTNTLLLVATPMRTRYQSTSIHDRVLLPGYANHVHFLRCRSKKQCFSLNMRSKSLEVCFLFHCVSFYAFLLEFWVAFCSSCLTRRKIFICFGSAVGLNLVIFVISLHNKHFKVQTWPERWIISVQTDIRQDKNSD